MTKHFGPNNCRMGLFFIENEKSKGGTDLRVDKQFTLGHIEFEMSLNNQRIYQVGSCI